MWYLSEQLVGLALFDPKVPAETKQAMAVAMEEDDDEDEGDKDVPKRIHLKKGPAPPKLETLVRPRTRELFRHIGINPSFLGLSPEEWKHHPEYKKAKERVNNIPVVNDHAERGIALIQEFNGRYTKKDEQHQFLLGVVADHHKRFSVASKASLTSGLQSVLANMRPPSSSG